MSAFSFSPSVSCSFLPSPLSLPTLPIPPISLEICLLKSPEANWESKKRENAFIACLCARLPLLPASPRACLLWLGYLSPFPLALFHCAHLFANCCKASVELVGIQMRRSMGPLGVN